MAEAVPTGLLMSGGQLVGVAATLVEEEKDRAWRARYAENEGRGQRAQS